MTTDTATQINTALMSRVADAIEAHSDHFDMRVFQRSDFFTTSFDPSEFDVIDLTECGSAGCVAGWVAALEPDTFRSLLTNRPSCSLQKEEIVDLERASSALLGLSPEQGEDLFQWDPFGDGWEDSMLGLSQMIGQHLRDRSYTPRSVWLNVLEVEDLVESECWGDTALDCHRVIKADHAVRLLRGLASGEFTFPEYAS